MIQALRSGPESDPELTVGEGAELRDFTHPYYASFYRFFLALVGGASGTLNPSPLRAAATGSRRA